MQAQKTVQFVSVRFIALAFALLAALLLASAAGYIIRGGAPSAGSTVAPTTLHVQQMPTGRWSANTTQHRPPAANRSTSGAGGTLLDLLSPPL